MAEIMSQSDLCIGGDWVDFLGALLLGVAEHSFFNCGKSKRNCFAIGQSNVAVYSNLDNLKG